MNNKNELVKDEEDIHEYIFKMSENAKKHGIMITAVFVNAPLLDKGTDCITPYGQKHPELVINSCAKTGLRMLAQADDDERFFEEDIE